MGIKESLSDFVIVFVVTLVVASIVTYLYSLIVHGTGVFNWETSSLLAIILGIILPIHRAIMSKKR